MKTSHQKMHKNNLQITAAKTIAEFRCIEDLQQQIWGTSAMDVVPDHILLTFAKNGGIVLLARRADAPVGFAFGFLGKTADGALKICSHQAGVIPTEQNRGVGFALKVAQREAALAAGISVMTWTFDPLQSRNAHFNMRKLGATSRKYLPELYGTMRDALNADIPSDRLEAFWQLNSPETESRLAGASPTPELSAAPMLNPCKKDDMGFPVPSVTRINLTERRYFVEIPADIQAIKKNNRPLAVTWRLHTRAIFQKAFEAGYHICDFVYCAAEARAFYMLSR